MTTKLILVGGFLGAGKTTLLLESALWLRRQGYRVGLITNDQGEQLVDTNMAHDADIPVTEVAGGCFCCRFPDLLNALQRLEQTVAPDVILAEPVGSCTDLAATVLRPLTFYHGERFTLAPLTVLVGSDHSAAQFSARVDYLYEKQLAEAEYILLNKSDLLSIDETQRRIERFGSQHANAQVQAISARQGSGIEGWLRAMLSSRSRLHQQLELDYGSYAEAEAELGWLNVRGILRTASHFSPEVWISRCMSRLRERLAAKQKAIAHLKIHLHTARGIFKASVTTMEGQVSWDSQVADVVTDQAQFLLNLRAAASPPTLEEAVRATLGDAGDEWQVDYDIAHFESFSPAPPRPTYRMLELLDAR